MTQTEQTMRAAVLSSAPGELRIEEIPVPSPGFGEVLIRVQACGVCHSDLHVMNGDISFPTPAVMGHEVAGVVAEVGVGVGAFAVGDEVVTTFIMPCQSCGQCRDGRGDLCSAFFEMNRLRGVLYDGTSRLRRRDGEALAMYSMGGFADAAVAPASAVFKRPACLSAADAAVLGCAFFTGYGAVRRAGQLARGEHVAVIAAGGVGLAIIQVARASGASMIVAVDVADDKLELARVNGATHCVNARSEDAVSVVRDLCGGGADVVFEALGTPATFSQAVEMVADGGRVVAVGIAPLGVMAEVEITRVVRRALTISGSYGARPHVDMPELLRLVEQGDVKPGLVVSRTYPLEDVARAYRELEDGTAVGRTVIVNDAAG